MSDMLITYSNKNKDEQYHLLTTREKRDVNTTVTNFIQELVTEKGTVLFDKEYGTYFIRDLGDQVNIYKVKFLIDKTLTDIQKKYGIENIEVTGTSKNNGFLDVHMNIEFSEFAVNSDFQVLYDGNFTTKTILEMS